MGITTSDVEMWELGREKEREKEGVAERRRVSSCYPVHFQSSHIHAFLCLVTDYINWKTKGHHPSCEQPNKLKSFSSHLSGRSASSQAGGHRDRSFDRSRG